MVTLRLMRGEVEGSSKQKQQNGEHLRIRTYEPRQDYPVRNSDLYVRMKSNEPRKQSQDDETSGKPAICNKSRTCCQIRGRSKSLAVHNPFFTGLPSERVLSYDHVGYFSKINFLIAVKLPLCIRQKYTPLARFDPSNLRV